MRKQLSITFALVCAVACKTESPTPAQSGSSEGPRPTGRSAKIDIKPMARPTTPPPALPPGSITPEDRANADPNARQDWRSRRNARIDADGDGVISDEERAAAMRERIGAMRARLDTDGDGKLTPAELGAARGRMHFDDPAALDTNHDGEISADELAAGMEARRDQWRASRQGSGTAVGSDGQPVVRNLGRTGSATPSGQ